MKLSLSFIIAPLLILLMGCSTRISHHHGYDYGHGGHNHVSVGVRSGKSGAAVIGALVVGGIIGSIIADSEHEKQHAREQALSSDEHDVVESDSDISEAHETATTQAQQQTMDEYNQQQAKQQSKIQWYQLGKDGLCYLMGIEQGVTNVISTAESNSCESK
jgi:hypothetical protein